MLLTKKCTSLSLSRSSGEAKTPDARKPLYTDQHLHVQSKSVKLGVKLRLELTIKADMTDRFANAPIFYTVAQINFGAVLDMEAYVSGIQKVLRNGFPDFSKDTVNEVEVKLPDSNAGGAPEVRTKSSSRWNFKSADQTSGYALTVSSIAFHTTAYEESMAFQQALLYGLRIVNEQVTISYTDGVGMRTLDVLVPGEGETLDMYVSPSLLGIQEHLPGELKYSVLEASLVGPYGELKSRAALLIGKVGIPMDLTPFPLKLTGPTTRVDGQHLILDNDCVNAERIAPFDQVAVAEKLKEVKGIVTNAFLEAVTPYAISKWK